MEHLRATPGAADLAPAPDAASTRVALEAYYARYYRDTLGIPDWRAHVAARLDDRAQEGRRVARLEEALGRSVRGLRLLDVGCGPGGFAAAAVEAGARVWGVDGSAEAVAIAARRVERAGIARAVAEALPYADGTFDVVHCYSTLEHVADASRTVAEMLRVLQPTGALYLHMPHRWSCQEGHYKIFWIPGLPPWAARAWVRARGRPPAFLATLRPLTEREAHALVARAGGRVSRVLDGGEPRRVGGPLWPLVRAYYRTLGIRPHVELVARRG
jgi:SAM-dependent methyltransferase